MSNIALNNTFTSVRGGGFGRHAWIARITGTDPKFGLRREFCRKNERNLSGSGRSGSIRFDVSEPGIYEFRDFCIGSTARNWRWSGFCELTADGAVELTLAQVKAKLQPVEV